MPKKVIIPRTSPVLGKIVFTWSFLDLDIYMSTVASYRAFYKKFKKCFVAKK